MITAESLCLLKLPRSYFYAGESLVEICRFVNLSIYVKSSHRVDVQDELPNSYYLCCACKMAANSVRGTWGIRTIVKPRDS